MMNRQLKFHSHQNAVILQANYDEIFSRTGECRICLTQQQIDWILSQSDFAAWPTRWNSPSGGEIDRSKIAIFHADLVRRLMTMCDQCEDDMYELRQNSENPCQLEQSTDGGLTWTLAFDYSECMRAFELDQPLSRFEPETGRAQYSYDEGVTWVDAPDPRYDSPVTPDPFTGVDDVACWHSANATELMRRMMMDSGDELLLIVTFIVNILLVVITGGAAIPVAIANIVSGLLAAGLGEARTQMDAAAWTKVNRILYCAHDEPGGWSFEAYASIFDQLAAEIPFPAILGVQGMLQAVGYIGLTNAGHLNLVEDPDCTAFYCGECGEQWIVANVSGSTAYGTYLGMFGEYHRFQSEDNGAGFHVLTIMTDAANHCCTIEDFVFIVGSGADAYFNIGCGEEQVSGNIAGDWILAVPYNYLSAQKATTGFTVDIKFNSL